MHHDRRPAALILLGVTETDALHLPVLVTNLKCALECSWQDPARLHPGPDLCWLMLASSSQMVQNPTGQPARRRTSFRDISPWRRPHRLGRPRLVYPSFSHEPRGSYRASGVTGVVSSDVVM